MPNDKVGYWAYIAKLSVDRVDYARETEKCIHRSERYCDIRNAKDTEYRRFFKTKQAAWGFLIEHQQRKIADARDILAWLSEGLESLEAKLKALPPAEKNPETKED